MKIIRLPEEIIMKIAAGEVVVGAYSVVKELVENALDAKAQNVSVEILSGGKDYIKVKDDGEGMNEKEILIAVEPHTTSKIKNLKDLYKIQTFGFRGEALASISRVSRMIITSRTIEDEVATSVEFIAGKALRKNKVNAPVGTTVEVKDLFFNIPARRKFLKSAQIEGRMVTEVVQKFILANSNIGFKYTKDHVLIYDIQPNLSFLERIFTIFPELDKDKILNLDFEGQFIKISGAISRPDITRPNRTAQIIFVNKRYVRSAELYSILEKGYAETLESGRHPYAIIFIEIDPEFVDVNVHPQKLEVKFSDSYKIYNELKMAIRNTVMKEKVFSITILKDEEKKKKQEMDKETFKPEKIFRYEKIQEDKFEYKLNEELTLPEYIEKSEKLEKKKEIERNIEEFRVLGIAGRRYIIVETQQSIIIIDFHAAHERMIYEDLKKRFFENGKLVSQKLMFTEKLHLDEIRMNIVKENIEEIEKLGFEIRLLNDEVEILSVPFNIRGDELKNIFLDLIETLRLKGIEKSEKIFKDILSNMACKMALKTGDDITDIERFVKDFFHSNIFPTCPHGRPYAYEITFDRLNKIFHRS